MNGPEKAMKEEKNKKRIRNIAQKEKEKKVVD